MFLPSGRVHGLGAGLVIFEIQQNSDTTYRAFDWNRTGLDGKPRELHIPQSLASIDFNDFEPSLLPAAFLQDGPRRKRPLVRDPLFTVELHEAGAGVNVPLAPRKMQIIVLLAGRLQVHDAGNALALAAGQFCLVPASLGQVTARAEAPATFLWISL